MNLKGFVVPNLGFIFGPQGKSQALLGIGLQGFEFEASSENTPALDTFEALILQPPTCHMLLTPKICSAPQSPA